MGNHNKMRNPTIRWGSRTAYGNVGAYGQYPFLPLYRFANKNSRLTRPLLIRSGALLDDQFDCIADFGKLPRHPPLRKPETVIFPPVAWTPPETCF